MKNGVDLFLNATTANARVNHVTISCNWNLNFTSQLEFDLMENSYPMSKIKTANVSK